MTPAELNELASAFTRDGSASVIQTLLADVGVGQREAVEQVAREMRLLEEMAEHQVDAA